MFFRPAVAGGLFAFSRVHTHTSWCGAQVHMGVYAMHSAASSENVQLVSKLLDLQHFDP